MSRTAPEGTDPSGPHFCIACNAEVESDLCLDGEHTGKLVAVEHMTPANMRCSGVNQPVLFHRRVMGKGEPQFMLLS
jgi:hypothetical protein